MPSQYNSKIQTEKKTINAIASALKMFIIPIIWFTGQPGQVGTPISGQPAGTPGSGGPRRMNANKSGSKDLVGPKSGISLVPLRFN